MAPGREPIHLLWRMSLAGLLTVSAVHAQDGTDGKSAPPFAVGGFRYQHIPPRTQMNICESAICTPGSKVSYIIFAPDPDPSFEQYKAERTKLAEALKSRAPTGTTSTFDPPEQTKDRIFTIFKARRVDTFADGSKSFVLSQRVFGARMSIDLISSSMSSKAAEDNAALFMLPIMLTLAHDELKRGR